jgi:arylsulfatase
MTTRTRSLTFMAIALGVFIASPAVLESDVRAQTGGTEKSSQSGATKTLDTRIGKLEFTHDFANGYPTKETVERLYDERDFQRACQAYLWSLPAVAFTAWQRGTNRELGAKNGQIVALLSYEARRGVLTANATTPYYLGFADLSSGPLVLEMPPRGVQGAINDSWQNAIPETEKPGKYLVLAPGQKGPDIGGGIEGLTQWEVTIAETLSRAGYATAAFGKWRLGSDQGRLPNAQGFDEWYGIPRTTDEALWPGDPAAKAAGVSFEHIMEGRKGEKSRNVAVYDLEQRRLIDAEITRRTIDFMKRSVQSSKPFYAYVPFTLVHFPSLPNPKFAGKTNFGDFPDALAEMDSHVGEILDAIDALNIRDNTIVVFTSDNGPEAIWPWQGSSGPWRGYYFTHMEGSLRTPFIIRWPGRIPANRVSNEIVHEVDTFTTFVKLAGAQVPQDRPIDGVDQTDFFLGKSDKSNREGFPVFVADRLEGVKWRNWKVVFYDEQRDWWTPPTKLGSPKAFNLITDPKEEYPQTGLLSSWIAGPAIKVMVDFEQSLKRYPAIAPGMPDPYAPAVPR